MEIENVKGIPYGVSDYDRIVKRNYYYVDKTNYLDTVEKAGEYLFFIRPRRFGKSLFLSVMEAYYDVLHKNRFEELFKGTWIFDHPSEERSTYLVLKLNFSAVNPTVDKMESSFLHHIRGKALLFLEKYSDYLTKDKNKEYFEKTIRETYAASDILASINDLCSVSNRKLYVIIDEYDNFANTLLSTAGEDSYQDLTHGEGFFRSFFNVLKAGTSDMNAPISRLFISGVSPLTLDDVTSGFNIGENISIDAAFNRMLGFSETDVREMLAYYRSAGLIKHDAEYLMGIMERWYGSYLFSKHADIDERLYNSDMVLYFLKEYFKTQSIPDDLIDRNVRIDYEKLRHLIIAGRARTKTPTPNGNFDKLKKIIEEGGTSSELEKGFSLEKLVDAKNFKSLLFYLGLLTIETPERDKIRLKIPNETVKRLYYDYIKEAYRETHIFDLDLSKYSDLMTDMAYEGKWEALVKFITSRMQESMSLRDLITGEKSIQAFLNVYLGLSNLYIIHVEKEYNKGYADIVMEPFLARYEGIKYSYVLEIKYLKPKKGRKPGSDKIQQMKTEAEEQLKRYSLDKRFRKTIVKTTLIKLVLIFSGHELMHVEKVG